MVNNNPSGNIFFNMESLAFAMPLILLCTGYAYFHYIPLSYGLPILGGIGLILFIRAQLQKSRDTKFQNLDEGTIKDLVGEDNNNESGEKKKQTDAKKEKVHRRLAAEKKKAESKKKTNKSSIENDEDHDDDNDVDALMTFAKGGAKSKKKR